jgi:hypothetical protein
MGDPGDLGGLTEDVSKILLLELVLDSPVLEGAKMFFEPVEILPFADQL